MDLPALQAVVECPFRWEEALAEAEALAVQECRQWEDQVEAKGNRAKVAKGCRRWGGCAKRPEPDGSRQPRDATIEKL